MPYPAPAHKSFSDRTSRYQEITDKIVAELEKGCVPWVQPWAGVSAPLGLPRNAATGRAYSGINILILWCAVAERGFTTQNGLTSARRRISALICAHRECQRSAEAGDGPEAIAISSAPRFSMPTSARISRPTSLVLPQAEPHPRDVRRSVRWRLLDRRRTQTCSRSLHAVKHGCQGGAPSGVRWRSLMVGTWQFPG